MIVLFLSKYSIPLWISSSVMSFDSEFHMQTTCSKAKIYLLWCRGTLSLPKVSSPSELNLDLLQCFSFPLHKPSIQLLQCLPFCNKRWICIPRSAAWSPQNYFIFLEIVRYECQDNYCHGVEADSQCAILGLETLSIFSFTGFYFLFMWLFFAFSFICDWKA